MVLSMPLPLLVLGLRHCAESTGSSSRTLFWDDQPVLVRGHGALRCLLLAVDTSFQFYDKFVAHTQR